MSELLGDGQGKRWNGLWLIARWAVGLGVMGAIALLLLLSARANQRLAVGTVVAPRWQTVFHETFEGEFGAGWTTLDASDHPEEYTWGVNSYLSTSAGHSAWCVGGGADGRELVAGSDAYPSNVDSWLIYGPIELDDGSGAYLGFDWWLETEVAAAAQGSGQSIRTIDGAHWTLSSGDWFGWCVLTEELDLAGARCTYVSGSTDGWARAAMDLAEFLPTETRGATPFWIAFRFVSDGEATGGRGAFVDDVKLQLGRDHQIFLPLLRRDPVQAPPDAPSPRSVLENGGFEADWAAAGGTHRVAVYRADGSASEENRPAGIQTPPGWMAWFRESPDVWAEPRVHGVSEADNWRRVRSGEGALEVSTNYQGHDAGLFQHVDVEPGATVRLSAWAHAWSNSDEGPERGHPGWSEGAGFDCFFTEEEAEGLESDLENFTFRLGLDPTGGVDPEADTVEWGEGAHIYNCFAEVPPVQVEAQSRRVTVFLRSSAQWRFEHNHAYWDDVELSVIDGDGDWTSWPYPVFDRGSRIGVHSILPNRVGSFAEDLVAGGTHFPVVKAVDDLGWLEGIKESSPETILIGRVVSPMEGCQDVDHPNTDLDEMARALMSFILDELTRDPGKRGVIEYWEVVNEPDPPGTEGYRRLAELMIKCMEKAERYGLKLAIFSLNAGTPEWDQMEAMVETGVFARAKEGGHILALHEGTFVSHDPTTGWGGSIPGAPHVEGAGSLNFRYRYLYHLLEQRDEVIPLVVSEWYCGDEASAETETIIDALRWYDDEASKDYYFWATCPFTLGPTPQWEHTDYERFYPGLVQHMIAIRDRENAVPGVRAWWRMLLRGLGWW